MGLRAGALFLTSKICHFNPKKSGEDSIQLNLKKIN